MKEIEFPRKDDPEGVKDEENDEIALEGMTGFFAAGGRVRLGDLGCVVKGLFALSRLQRQASLNGVALSTEGRSQTGCIEFAVSGDRPREQAQVEGQRS